MTEQVHFTFTDMDTNRSGMIDAAISTLGMSRTEAQGAFTRSARVVCRPDQFARFLIVRSQKVSGNYFRCLEPKLVTIKEPDYINVMSR